MPTGLPSIEGLQQQQQQQQQRQQQQQYLDNDPGVPAQQIPYGTVWMQFCC
jgi:hypothetical protein